MGDLDGGLMGVGCQIRLSEIFVLLSNTSLGFGCDIT